MRDTPETTKITESGVPSSPSSWFELAEHAERLELERDALKARVDDLELWKRQQLLVESEWEPQEVGRLLGVTLGRSIRKNIQPKVEELLERVKALESAAAVWQEERDNICAALGEHPESPLDIAARIRTIRDEVRACCSGADVQSRNALIRGVVALTAEKQEATRTAKSIMKFLSKRFSDLSPDFRVSDNLIGILLQISNAVTVWEDDQRKLADAQDGWAKELLSAENWREHYRYERDRAEKLHQALEDERAHADRLAERLASLVKLDDEFQSGDTNYENAYYSFYKGEYDTWREARKALAAHEALRKP